MKKWSSETWIVSLLILGHVLMHLLTSGRYGMFRDEFYYIDCARHLDWGYVDHPPLSIAMLSGSLALLGDSAEAVRLLPAVLGAAVIVLIWVLTREIGGNAFARILSVVAWSMNALFSGNTGYYSMNAFDYLFWALAFWILIRIIQSGNGRWWLWFGLVAGLGLLNKISMLFFLFGTGVGLMLTPARKHLSQKWIWFGAAVAAVLFLPYVLWQIPHGWPTLRFMANAQRYKIAALTPFQFLGVSILDNNALNMLVWLPGLAFLMFAKAARPYRLLGWIFAVVLALLIVQHGKPYYLGPAYAILFAAGGVAVERLLSGRRAWARVAVVILVVVGGLLTLPFAVPVLPVDGFIAYQNALGVNPPQAERHATGVLPQSWSDRFGWENMAATVSSVYRTLTPDQKEDCVVVTRNYGEAGAINYFRKRYELPPAVSEHNNYYLWGPGRTTGKALIVIGVSPEELQKEFESVEQRAVVVSPYAMPYETDLPVCVCFGLKIPIEEAWGPPRYI